MQILKSENKKTSILPLFAVGTLALHLLTFLVLIFHWSILQRLNRQTTLQSLVQLIDGQAITVDPQENLARYPETVRRFVGESMTLMLTWSQKQPPTTIWEISSPLINEGAKSKLQSYFAKLNKTNQAGNITRGADHILVIQKISQPTKIADGKWKVEMRANQLIFNGSDRLGRSIPVNKQVLIQAMDDPPTILPSNPLPLQLAAYNLAETKLKIYQVCELQDKTCTENPK
ncbi:MAG: hypothetical protein KME23_09175 [Goleter apudmare HA4340-LM2]|jgi:hypothetical protein|nr:hypothetical protein [Goleter apudmare HA4340-LM2]